ncbi:MAG: RluA family pseudouridine synthase [Desulforudis sp.]|jgi:23S rRNA pseudouridine1911/1915/1917 synthase|nr:MAG: RluA family pseudouridine synthase [Desulforudis sp.]
MAKTFRLVVGDDDAGLRLDAFLAVQNLQLTRSRIQNLIRDELVTVNENPSKTGYRVRTGDVLTMVIPEPETLQMLPEPIPLDIYYEDGDLIVVNKARGMVVHPGAGHFCGTLVNALLHHCSDLSGINGILRPGIVHRLDKDTSGLLMVAKNDATHLALATQLQERTVQRNYLALVYGRPRQERGTVRTLIGRHPQERKRMAVNVRNGKEAVTHYQVARVYRGYTLLRLKLETGRTHQIRVHMTHIGHPLVGDLVYGRARPALGLEGQFLHAETLGFVHPSTGEHLAFTAPLPAELDDILIRLEGGD